MCTSWDPKHWTASYISPWLSFSGHRYSLQKTIIDRTQGEMVWMRIYVKITILLIHNENIVLIKMITKWEKRDTQIFFNIRYRYYNLLGARTIISPYLLQDSNDVPFEKKRNKSYEYNFSACANKSVHKNVRFVIIWFHNDLKSVDIFFSNLWYQLMETLWNEVIFGSPTSFCLRLVRVWRNKAIERFRVVPFCPRIVYLVAIGRGAITHWWRNDVTFHYRWKMLFMPNVPSNIVSGWLNQKSID